MNAMFAQRMQIILIKYNSLCQRVMSTGKCWTACFVSLPLHVFHNQKCGRLGVASVCRGCTATKRMNTDQDETFLLRRLANRARFVQKIWNKKIQENHAYLKATLRIWVTYCIRKKADASIQESHCHFNHFHIGNVHWNGWIQKLVIVEITSLWSLWNSIMQRNGIVIKSRKFNIWFAKSKTF